MKEYILLNQDKKIYVYENMKKYGGSFVKALADCIMTADKINLIKLETAFPVYMTEYADRKWDKNE